MILVHDWGHFNRGAFLWRVPRGCVFHRVRAAALGFKWGATDYRISALPLGGYVRMAGQDLSEVDSNDVAPTGAPDELMSSRAGSGR